ncbi:MAG TPA: hypothetical protein VGQ87_02075 [Patescibacteria group bacterium]|nr:hypothetical protein [Patescibacteria group bacterium]
MSKQTLPTRTVFSFAKEDDEKMSNHVELIRRVKGEFFEMPGLRLTEPQARRLWGMQPDICTAVLNALVQQQFLQRTPDGAFVRQ